MTRKMINTRSHTKVKPCTINLQILQNWEGKKSIGEANKKSIGEAKYVQVCM